MAEDRERRLYDLFERALALPPDARTGFAWAACNGDPALHQHLVDLLKINSELDADSPPFAQRDPLIGKRFGPYLILRVIGRGGMGRVYLARRVDGTFDRNVAIKVIDPEATNADASERFEQERRLAATLDHPCIARILDGGRSDDGRLFCVMEYVDGLPIDGYSDRHRLTVRQRLALFARVCEAVAHAHRNLIVHRDLKPGNILVDRTGTPKLLDFGIAKALTPAGLEDSDPTSPHLKRLTPAYASPEQHEGHPAQIGMDVYSLGILLHALLAGALPEAVDSDETTRTGDRMWRKPSFVARRTAGLERDAMPGPSPLEGDIDAIVLKAIQFNPKDRYESVDAFRDDIRRYLEGYPVRARKSTRLYVAGKFIGRHRAMVALATLALAGIAVAVIALYFSWRQANDERVRAETRFGHLRTLASSLFAVDAELGALPGSTRPRRTLVESVSRYLDALRAEAASEPWLALEIAEGYRRLGDVQGNPSVANLGDLPAALRSYETALSLLTEVDRQAPSDAVQVALAKTYASQADVLLARSETSGAAEGYERALALARDLSTRFPGDDRYQELLSGIYRPLGDVHLRAGGIDRAQQLYRAALAIDTGLMTRSTGRPEYRRLLALSEIRMGAVATKQNDWMAARDAFARAADLLSSPEGGKGDASVRRELAVAHARLGSLLAERGDRSAAGYLEQAVATLRDLSHADPADARLRRDLIEALIQHGDAARLDSVNRARGLYLEARDLVLRLSGNPDDAGAARLAAIIESRLRWEKPSPPAPAMQLVLLVDGKRMPLEPGRPPAEDTEILVAPADGRRGLRYLLLFGAQGPPQLLDERQLSSIGWRVKASGPPPAQTIMLIDASGPLEERERAAILDAVGAVPAARTVDSDAVVSWTSGSEPQIESAAAARGDFRPKWIDEVQSRLARVPGVTFSARTFPLAPRSNR